MPSGGQPQRGAPCSGGGLEFSIVSGYRSTHVVNLKELSVLRPIESADPAR
jgi:hypothetical protein